MDLPKITPPSLQVLIGQFSEQSPNLPIAQLQILQIFLLQVQDREGECRDSPHLLPAQGRHPHLYLLKFFRPVPEPIPDFSDASWRLASIRSSNRSLHDWNLQKPRHPHSADISRQAKAEISSQAAQTDCQHEVQLCQQAVGKDRDRRAKAEDADIQEQQEGKSLLQDTISPQEHEYQLAHRRHQLLFLTTDTKRRWVPPTQRIFIQRKNIAAGEQGWKAAHKRAQEVGSDEGANIQHLAANNRQE